MSGGIFDYKEYHINDIIARIEEEISIATATKPEKIVKRGINIYQRYANSLSFLNSYDDVTIEEIVNSYMLNGWHQVSELISNNKKIITLSHPNDYHPIEIHQFEYEEYEDGEYYPEYSDETIAEFKNAIEVLKKARIYINRIDYLIAGDDGEESFHKRLNDELKKLQ